MRARLVVEAGEAKPPVCELDPDQAVTLGRSRDNTIVLRDEHASRLHARVYFEKGHWMVRDFGLNGTRIDGERIQNEAELEHGQELRIGDTRLRFTLENGPTISGNPTSSLSSVSRATTKFIIGAPEPSGNSSTFINPPATSSASTSPAPSTATNPSTAATKAFAVNDLVNGNLRPDDLSSLCDFMSSALKLESPAQMVAQALQLILSQTQGSVAGYLSADPADPLPKIVLPEKASVDVPLSRQLTRRVHRDRKTAWLFTDLASTRAADSLMSFSDALCVPLLANSEVLGAIHVYRRGEHFSDREVKFCEVLAGYLGSSLQLIRERRNLEAENSRLRAHTPAVEDLVGDSPLMQQLRLQIQRAAPQNSTVLVRGESGVGKELVALALHRQSSRNKGPLVVVNCAAITPTLMEAELFGYVKGAFTGADRTYPGLFQQADEGTLFLDEVGELSPECQAKLLRVIEGKAFKPVGSTTEIKVDVRIIAATHRDLEHEIRTGRFRDDLRYRLSVITISVPPLREHPEDVPFLAQYFLDRLATECRRLVKLTPAAMKKLEAYAWPGNVRQLRAVLESAVVMSESDVLDADDLKLSNDTARNEPPSLNIAELEAWAIRHAMRQVNNNQVQAAQLLGIHRDTLAAKLKKLSL